VAIVVVGAVAAVLILVRGDRDETSPATTAAPSTTADSTATTGVTTTEPATTAPAMPDTATAVWPTAASGVRYDDPVEAATGFAGFVGFDDPVVGEFMQGDSRSGEVEIRPTATGPATTVFVRQLEDDRWWVLGSATENIRLDSPGAGEEVTNPVLLTGAANAFEGHVSVTVIEDDGAVPVATGFVTGAMGEMGPFDSTLPLVRSPTHELGAVLLTTDSAEDGRLWEAAVIRVRFTLDA
jgi:hypothetical protein